MDLRLLLIDDDPDIRRAFSEFLKQAGYGVDQADNLQDAATMLSLFRYSAALVDLSLTSEDRLEGFEVVDWVRERAPWTRLVIMSGHDDKEVMDLARDKGVDAFLPKPQPLREVERVLSGLLTVDDVARENLRTAVSISDNLANELRDVHLAKFEDMSAEQTVAAVRLEVAPRLNALVGRAHDLIMMLPSLCVGDVGDPLQGEIDEFDIVPGSSPVDGAPRVFGNDISVARGWVSAANDLDALGFISEMLCGKLQKAKERFGRAFVQANKWGIITEGSEAVRETLRAMDSVLSLAAKAVDPTGAHQIYKPNEEELQVALQVRALLCGFRRNILGEIPAGLDELSDAEVVSLVDKIHCALAELFASPDYELLRPHDRYNIRGLSERLVATGTKDVAGLKHVIGDLRSCVQMLDAVNRREMLINHDREMRARALDILAEISESLKDPPKDGGWLQVATLLEALKSIAWRDEKLDQLVASEIKRGPSGAAEIRGRVVRIRGALQRLAI